MIVEVLVNRQGHAHFPTALVCLCGAAIPTAPVLDATPSCKVCYRVAVDFAEIDRMCVPQAWLRDNPAPHQRKHGLESTFNHGCRCEPCRRTKYLALARRRARMLDEDRVKHGTRYGYIVGCRCELCRLAQREYDARKYQARKLARLEARLAA